MYKFLDQVLPEKEIAQLLECVKKNEVFFFEGHSKNYDELVENSFLNSLSSLLENWNKEVDIHLLDLKDEASTKKVTPDYALSYYKKGMGLLFNDINEEDNFFNEKLESLCEDLGVSSATIRRNLIYATPKGGGTATHFDQNINLIIQIHGEKSWWIEENKSISNPLTRHTLGTQADSELASYLEEPFPTEIKYKREYKLVAGSVLFVPRGHWHKTYAHSDALALNFTFSVPSWSDILSMALRARVIQSDLWRESVLGLNNEATAKEKLLNFQFLIDSLKEDIQSWRAEDILGFIELQGHAEDPPNE